MYNIAYQSHITTNAKVYRSTLQRIRQWAYAHAGHRRSQVSRHFTGGAKARNSVWQSDDLIIYVRQLAQTATVISVRAGRPAQSSHYTAHVFAYTTSAFSHAAHTDDEPDQYAFASVISQGLNFASPWDEQQAGQDALSHILDHARDHDRPSNGKARQVTAGSEPGQNEATLTIAQAADLRQDDTPMLAVPDSASPELRQELESRLNWCEVGYADPAACLIIARGLSDPETAARWLNAELVAITDETGYIKAAPTAEIAQALDELYQQYGNSRIYQTINTIAMLTELLSSRIAPPGS